MAWKKPNSFFDTENQPARSGEKGHTLDLNRIDEVFDAILPQIHTMSQWEQNFIESLKDQWDNNGRLSDKQLEILERIYLKV